MTEAATVISAVQAEHDNLTSFAARLDDPDLACPSGAAPWTVGEPGRGAGAPAPGIRPPRRRSQ